MTNISIYPLSLYQKKIEGILIDYIPRLGPKNSLRDACEYALLNGGKRFRPALVMMVAEALSSGADVQFAALAIELLHTASLIADDLPCMDNEEFRRNHPTLHKKYNEATAVLVTYSLIAAGYECLAKNAAVIKKSALPFAGNADAICVAALENASFNTGLFGASGGQYLDIFTPDLSLPTLLDIIRKKTVSLFEVSFLLGWLYGGGSLDRLNQVKQAAGHFGMAFQIADDLGDIEQDNLNGRLVNIAAVFGKERAQEVLEQEVQGYLQTLKDLKIDSKELCHLAVLLRSKQ